MLALILAAALAQAPTPAPITPAPSPAPDPCYVGEPDAAPAACPRWRQLALAVPVTEARGFVDPASARREGNHVDVSTLTIPREALGGEVARFVVRVRLDCTARTTMVLHLTGYNAAGARIHDAAEAPSTPTPAPAGTPRAALIDQFCAS